MSLQPFVFAILAFGLVSGMFSPILVPNVTVAVLMLAPGLLVTNPQVLVFLVYLVGATFTIMLGGIPAALYERVTGTRESTAVSMWIWLAATGLLAAPAVVMFLQVGL